MVKCIAAEIVDSFEVLTRDSERLVEILKVFGNEVSSISYEMGRSIKPRRGRHAQDRKVLEDLRSAGDLAQNARYIRDAIVEEVTRDAKIEAAQNVMRGILEPHMAAISKSKHLRDNGQVKKQLARLKRVFEPQTVEQAPAYAAA